MKKDHVTEVESIGKAPKILLVDDDLIAIKLVNYVLQEMGCEVDLGFCGADLLERLAKNTYDIVITDWNLQDMLANNALSNLITDKKFGRKAKKKFFNTIPVVTYSAYDLSEIKIDGASCIVHCDHWKKPITPYEISHRTLRLLREVNNTKAA
jgi:CheY-like chemotaxis protein